MFDALLNKLRDAIREQRYVMTLHAEEEMDADELSIFDIESVILKGEVVERQRDEDRGDWKYLISGPSLDSAPVIVVVRLRPDTKAIIITVFAE